MQTSSDPPGYIRVTEPPRRVMLPFRPPLPSPSLSEAALGPVDSTDRLRLLVHEALAGMRLAAGKAHSAAAAIHGDASTPGNRSPSLG
jgi:hypothetical protein